MKRSEETAFAASSDEDVYQPSLEVLASVWAEMSHKERDQVGLYLWTWYCQTAHCLPEAQSLGAFCWENAPALRGLASSSKTELGEAERNVVHDVRQRSILATLQSFGLMSDSGSASRSTSPSSPTQPLAKAIEALPDDAEQDACAPGDNRSELDISLIDQAESRTTDLDQPANDPTAAPVTLNSSNDIEEDTSVDSSVNSPMDDSAIAVASEGRPSLGIAAPQNSRGRKRGRRGDLRSGPSRNTLNIYAKALVKCDASEKMYDTWYLLESDDDRRRHPRFFPSTLRWQKGITSVRFTDDWTTIDWIASDARRGVLLENEASFTWQAVASVGVRLVGSDLGNIAYLQQPRHGNQDDVASFHHVWAERLRLVIEEPGNGEIDYPLVLGQPYGVLPEPRLDSGSMQRTVLGKAMREAHTLDAQGKSVAYCPTHIPYYLIVDSDGQERWKREIDIPLSQCLDYTFAAINLEGSRLYRDELRGRAGGWTISLLQGVASQRASRAITSFEDTLQADMLAASQIDQPIRPLKKPRLTQPQRRPGPKFLRNPLHVYASVSVIYDQTSSECHSWYLCEPAAERKSRDFPSGLEWRRGLSTRLAPDRSVISWSVKNAHRAVGLDLETSFLWYALVGEGIHMAGTAEYGNIAYLVDWRELEGKARNVSLLHDTWIARLSHALRGQKGQAACHPLPAVEVADEKAFSLPPAVPGMAAHTWIGKAYEVSQLADGFWGHTTTEPWFLRIDETGALKWCQQELQFEQHLEYTLASINFEGSRGLPGGVGRWTITVLRSVTIDDEAVFDSFRKALATAKR